MADDYDDYDSYYYDDDDSYYDDSTNIVRLPYPTFFPIFRLLILPTRQTL